MALWRAPRYRRNQTGLIIILAVATLEYSSRHPELRICCSDEGGHYTTAVYPSIGTSMEFATQPGRDRLGVSPGNAPQFGDALLPHTPLRKVADSQGVIAPDGSLCVGLFKIPTEMLSLRMRDASRLTERIPRRFPTVAELQRALSENSIRVPPSPVHFPSALATFKRAVEGELRGSRFADTARRIDRLSPGQALSAADVGDLRGVLIDAVHVATVCAAVDQSHYEALNHRSVLQRGRDWLIDRVGPTRIRDPRIRARLAPMPFEEFSPTEIRVDADVWAQRLALAEDGSSVVRSICAAEHYVAEVLSKSSFEPRVRACHGGLEGKFIVSSRSSRRAIFSIEHRIQDVFAALELGRSVSQWIAGLLNENIDLVRLCKFFDRGAALGVQGNLNRWAPQVHARLNDIDDWADRFDGDGERALSDEERHDLAVLLLDAEICLHIAGHVQNVVRGVPQRDFWRRMWSASLQDREISRGMDLANRLPAPLMNDCHGAAEVVTNAAMLLGFSREDRGRGPCWRVPENPLTSLTWAMNRF